MKGALSLRIDDGVTDRLVTAHTTGLSFSKVAPGGHESLTARINLPRSAFPALGPSDRAHLYDTRTGRCIWDGYTSNPTPVDGQAGQAFDLAAVGGMTLAADETMALVYVDNALTNWAKTGDSQSSASVDTISAAPGVRESLRLQLNPGQPISAGSVVAAEYLGLDAAGMTIGAVRVIAYGGKFDGNYAVQIATRDPDGATTITGLGPIDIPFVGAGGFNVNGDSAIPIMRLVYTGPATNVVDETSYVDLVQLSVRGRRTNRYGVLVDGVAHGNPSGILASEVVEDVLGRFLGAVCDPALAAVTATTMPIYQLAWPDGATAQRVLDELARWEPDMLWSITDSGPDGHRFAYRPWPTTPRYEISVRDGYRETGSDDDICNRIAVSWTDSLGTKQTTIITATADQYPVLADLERAGRVRDADPITLEDGFGSALNAQTIGTQKLAAINTAATAATAVVRRRIYDHTLGCLVDPWEIEPGELVQVREIGKALRLTRMAYDDPSCATTLTLGDPVLTDEQRIARLARVS